MDRRTLSGRLFHSCGPATARERYFNLVLQRSKSPLAEDRNPGRFGIEEHGMTNDDIISWRCSSVDVVHKKTYFEGDSCSYGQPVET